MCQKNIQITWSQTRESLYYQYQALTPGTTQNIQTRINLEIGRTGNRTRDYLVQRLQCKLLGHWGR